MQNDFQIVKGKRKRKNRNNSINPENNLYLISESSVYKKLEQAEHEFISSSFCQKILETISQCLGSLQCVHEILCFGLGNFSDSKPALHQLAALWVLSKRFNSCVKVYDPLFNCVEIKLLKILDFEVLVDNEEGKRLIEKNKTSLLFFPHCPKQLINNFLWTNWNLSLKNCLLIGNSFSSIIEGNSKKILNTSAKYIVKVQKITEEFKFKNDYFLNNVFNDISLHSFNSVGANALFFTQTLEEEPIYSEEIELITNKVKELKVQNE